MAVAMYIGWMSILALTEPQNEAPVNGCCYTYQMVEWCKCRPSVGFRCAFEDCIDWILINVNDTCDIEPWRSSSGLVGRCVSWLPFPSRPNFVSHFLLSPSCRGLVPSLPSHNRVLLLQGYPSPSPKQRLIRTAHRLRGVLPANLGCCRTGIEACKHRASRPVAAPSGGTVGTPLCAVSTPLCCVSLATGEQAMPGIEVQACKVAALLASGNAAKSHRRWR
jgi:hypothetical protein